VNRARIFNILYMTIGILALTTGIRYVTSTPPQYRHAAASLAVFAFCAYLAYRTFQDAA
jgi:membrane associated rhomboid family serine protease